MAGPAGKGARAKRAVELERITGLERPAADPALWHLDPQIAFLNHGSFGACPKEVLARQQELRELLEREPVTFLVRTLEPRLVEARFKLSKFIGAFDGDLAFVTNATTGLNTVLRSLRFEPGDELLVTDHEYNASRNALEFAATQWRAQVVVAHLPFPVGSAAELEEAILAKVTARTRLAMVDHVTSQTGLVLPLGSIVAQIEGRGIPVLVDGAHAPGMIPLNLRKLGASYYTGNCHKWMCAPKGAAFLHVRKDRRPGIRPLVISHGANSPRKDISKFEIEFGWMGTHDPTAVLSIPAALEFMSKLMPGGWPELMQHNRALAVAARREICRALDIPEPCPAELLGSLASIPIPDSPPRRKPKSPLYLEDLQERIFYADDIEVPVIPWPKPPKRLLRVSAQAYNSLPQYQKLAAALQTRLAEKL